MTGNAAPEVLTCWLIPAEPARRHLASLIRDLAARFDAPIFEPHLTIYGTKAEPENAGELLERALAGCKPHRLAITGIDLSEEFTRTLFVQFETNDELRALSEDFRSASASQREYQLNPHLSLIYKKMSRETKSEIARSLRLPFDRVLFDSAQAVISPAKIKSREDVEAWRVVASRSLTG